MYIKVELGCGVDKIVLFPYISLTIQIHTLSVRPHYIKKTSQNQGAEALQEFMPLAGGYLTVCKLQTRYCR